MTTEHTAHATTHTEEQHTTAATTTTHTEAPTMSPPSLIGKRVLYVLSEGHSKGEKRPAFIVRDWGSHGGQPSCVNLRILTDGTNDFPTNHPGHTGTLWATSVRYSEHGEPGTWHWPASATKKA